MAPRRLGSQYQQPPGICNDAGGCKQGRHGAASLACSKRNTTPPINKQPVHIFTTLSNVHFDERFSNHAAITSPPVRCTRWPLWPMLVILMACINFCESFHGPGGNPQQRDRHPEVMGSSRTQLQQLRTGRYSSKPVCWFWQQVSPSGAGLYCFALRKECLRRTRNLSACSRLPPRCSSWLIALITTLLSGMYPAFHYG